MIDLRVSLGEQNGRQRHVTYRHNGSEYFDSVDLASGWHRQESIKRALASMGLASDHLALLDGELCRLAQQKNEQSALIEYPAITGAQLDRQEYNIEYLIPSILAAGQHTLLGGPHKILKTLVASDMAASLSIGGHFLGYFPVARAVRTAIMSGECGFPVIQENLRRIAKAAGTDLARLDNLLITTSLPKFGHLDHTDAMGRFILDNELEVIIVDCAYLAMDGADAGNVFEMGARLRSIGDVFVANNATMILLHHSIKGCGADGQPIDLENLSFAGFREFAAQWLLLSRRQRYEPGSGHHALWLSSGGRAGHSGLWGLIVDEGQYQPGAERRWNVQVSHYDEVRQQDGDQRQAAKDAKREERVERDVTTLLRALAKYPDGETERILHGASGLYGAKFNIALAAAHDAGQVVPCEIIKQSRKTPFQGWKLAGTDTTHE